MHFGKKMPLSGIRSDFSKLPSLLTRALSFRQAEKEAALAAAEVAEMEAAKETALTNYKSKVSNSPLYVLPTELIKEVLDWLPSSDAMAFSLACTRFYKIHASPTLEKSPSKQHKFDILAPLEHALGPWNSRPLCGGCLAGHKGSAYFPGQLDIIAPERRCKHTQQLVWLHPGWAASFDELKRIATDIQTTGRSYRSRHPGMCSLNTVNDSGKLYLMVDFSIQLLRCVLPLRPTMTDLRSLLQKFNVPICPHVSTADAWVAGLYEKAILSPYSFNTKWHKCPITNCKTYIRFEFNVFRHGNILANVLVLHTRRQLSLHSDPERKTWISQAGVTTDKPRFVDAWSSAWAWKLLNDEVDLLRFRLDLTPLTSPLRDQVRAAITRATAYREQIATQTTYRGLYGPLVDPELAERKMAVYNGCAAESIKRFA
jgi:hypothetical protein